MKRSPTIEGLIGVLLTSAFFLIGCSSTKLREPVPTPEPIVEIALEAVPEFRIDSMKASDRKEFEKTLPTDVREAFDSAATLQLQLDAGESDSIMIEEPRDKRALLDALYWDLAKSIPTDPNVSAVACKESGPAVSFRFEDENLLVWNYMIKPSYNCGWYDVIAGKRSYSRLLTVKESISRRIISQLIQQHAR